MDKEEYIGKMPLEEFKKLSYEEQGKYLDSLEGLVVETENIDINDLCSPISCSKEEYVKRHGYISFDELKKRINQKIDEVACDEIDDEVMTIEEAKTTYTKFLDSEELDNFTYLSSEDANLPCPIMVDSNMEFAKHNHELCLYVIQKEEETENEVIPITICEQPKVIGELANAELYIHFIQRNLFALRAYAYREIDSFDFYDAIDVSKGKRTNVKEEIRKIIDDQLKEIEE